MKLRVKLDRMFLGGSLLALLALERLESGITFRPGRRGFRDDPYRFYRALRERDPIHRTRPGAGWVLSRYRDVVGVLRDPGFSSDERHWVRWKRLRALGARAGIPDPYREDQTSMLRLDPPDHTRLRNLVRKAFTPRAVERMRPRVEARVKELLEPFGASGTMELVGDFAAPLPVVVIAEMLGVPVEDRERLRRWSDDAVQLLGDSSLEDTLRAVEALDQLRAYFAEQAEQRRREPRDDLLSALVAAEEEGERLGHAELLGVCSLLLVAGNETTTNLIANGLLALLRHPEQLALLRREPELMSNAVEEMLRWDSPVQLTSRIATEDLELGGTAVKKGQQCVLLLAGANRDPEAFPDPDRFDVRREAPRHLSFGHGVHFCVGAQLARMEATLALQALVTRYPKLSLATTKVAWRPNTVLRGPVSLPLRF